MAALWGRRVGSPRRRWRGRRSASSRSTGPSPPGPPRDRLPPSVRLRLPTTCTAPRTSSPRTLLTYRGRLAPVSRGMRSVPSAHSILNHMVLYQRSDPRAVDEVFAALADPTRRAILGRLREGEASVSELAQPFPVSLPAIAKHV